jgi:L,D-transpeptidase ErfK/SrfK
MLKKSIGWVVAAILMLAAYAAPVRAHTWREAEFANRPLFAYPLPSGREDIVGTLTTYKIQPGDTLLDVGRWFGLSAKEISDANGHMDWWLPPVGRVVILPTAHILPDSPRSGIILNVPEMRLYYYYPSPAYTRRHRKGKLTAAAFHGARVVYTFPVGLGRFDWKTPLGLWRVTAKVKDPTWVLPEDIYQEHLERDGEADRVVPGGGPDNPLGHYKLDLSIPEYGLHGTNVPWGIGMTVSHGCVRLFPEDIERLYSKTPVGTPGEFTYQPVKFGWRGDALYVEVHDDLYGKYPGLWKLAATEVQQQKLVGKVDLTKLEKAVVLRAGIPTYVGFGSAPPDGSVPETAAAETPPDTTASGTAVSPTPVFTSADSSPTSDDSSDSSGSAPTSADSTSTSADSTSTSADSASTSTTSSYSADSSGRASAPAMRSRMTAPPIPPTVIAPAADTDDDAPDNDAPDNRNGGDWQPNR